MSSGEQDQPETAWSQFVSEQYRYLTTTGRVTGRPHRIEIRFAIDQDTQIPAERATALATERFAASQQRDPHIALPSL